ncbi:peptide-methionine (S)-S-oxide reductase MsrA [Peptoniphilus sp. KCTC 25270]|uniref:peptide-methionine (S)-S-oxide reductase MsrA n=1 Tax=Peptoniphilus sp. KCTC 25270 TaxID=2897414 RepID=UPI001E3E8F3E|nr:peptide-methionine (S)-S-oxide reductase MsrA [Peptoniphilus sp. KCTC 25270]MCD1146953.1 peptide-methionine (S)-S-oxide reductase MsrA [Peptoniphilus sp. KCTC 25270]
MKTIYLAGGCFWGVEEYFQRTKGILDTSVGYVNSKKENPTYEEVCSGRTKAAEGVSLSYDENIISLKEILNHFYRIIDPFSLNRQKMDIGTQYRTGLYYTNEEEKLEFEQFLKEKQKLEKRKIVIEVEPLENFYLGEEYHQRYLQKNPNGYCHIRLPEKE